jgi:hypothetical protein
LSYIGQVEVPFGFNFDGTTVGGLSAISYDPGRQLYYVVSDDRSAKNPARFYTVRIPLSDNTLGDVEFVAAGPEWRTVSAAVSGSHPAGPRRASHSTRGVSSCTGPAKGQRDTGNQANALLLDLDNVEGNTLGPRLSGGHQSVVLVTDNFNPVQTTQFFAFAL